MELTTDALELDQLLLESSPPKIQTHHEFITFSKSHPSKIPHGLRAQKGVILMATLLFFFGCSFFTLFIIIIYFSGLLTDDSSIELLYQQDIIQLFKAALPCFILGLIFCPIALVVNRSLKRVKRDFEATIE